MLCVDLFCGLGGWAEGFLAEDYKVVGFDIERFPYPGQLVIQDVRTIHGSQFKDAAVIVASPPCNEYSYQAMPWKRAKALPPPSNELFDTCFRIQREASKAAGHRVPLIVENVRGAQKWVGRARWHFGSYYLWGDVPALMPTTGKFKLQGMNWSNRDLMGQDFTRVAGAQAAEGFKGIPHKPTGHWTNPAENGVKNPRILSATTSSKSAARKQASALIAKIPFPLANWIARCFR